MVAIPKPHSAARSGSMSLWLDSRSPEQSFKVRLPWWTPVIMIDVRMKLASMEWLCYCYLMTLSAGLTILPRASLQLLSFQGPADVLHNRFSWSFVHWPRCLDFHCVCLVQAVSDARRPGLVTAMQVSVLQQMLKAASGGQSGLLVSHSAINFASHGSASVPNKSRSK